MCYNHPIMKRQLSLIIIGVLFFALTAIGCAKKPESSDKLLVRMGGGGITMNEFQARIDKLPGYYKGVVEGTKKRFLDEMIAEKLFYEEAIRKGINQDKEVLDVINEAKKKIIITKFITTEVDEKAAASEAEIRKFYEANKEKFRSPELWRASHVLVASEQDARAVLDELAKGANFEELAKTRSTDATASRGGDIGYFRKGQLVPDFEKACLKLSVGQLSDVVHTQFGYHVIKLTDHKEPQAEPYEKVGRLIAGELQRQKKRELFDALVLRLKDQYQVQINEELAKSFENQAPQKEGEKK